MVPNLSKFQESSFWTGKKTLKICKNETKLPPFPSRLNNPYLYHLYLWFVMNYFNSSYGILWQVFLEGAASHPIHSLGYATGLAQKKCPNVIKSFNLSQLRASKCLWNVTKSSIKMNVPGFDNWHTSHMSICLFLLMYTWFWAWVTWHVCSFFSLRYFKVSVICLVLIILYCLKTYSYIFDL